MLVAVCTRKYAFGYLKKKTFLIGQRINQEYKLL